MSFTSHQVNGNPNLPLFYDFCLCLVSCTAGNWIIIPFHTRTFWDEFPLFYCSVNALSLFLLYISRLNCRIDWFQGCYICSGFSIINKYKYSKLLNCHATACTTRQKCPGMHGYYNGCPISNVQHLRETLSIVVIKWNQYLGRYVNNWNASQEHLLDMEDANGIHSRWYRCSQTRHLLHILPWNSTGVRRVLYVSQSDEKVVVAACSEQCSICLL